MWHQKKEGEKEREGEREVLQDYSVVNVNVN